MQILFVSPDSASPQTPLHPRAIRRMLCAGELNAHARISSVKGKPGSPPGTWPDLIPDEELARCSVELYLAPPPGAELAWLAICERFEALAATAEFPLKCTWQIACLRYLAYKSDLPRARQYLAQALASPGAPKQILLNERALNAISLGDIKQGITDLNQAVKIKEGIRTAAPAYHLNRFRTISQELSLSLPVQPLQVPQIHSTRPPLLRRPDVTSQDWATYWSDVQIRSVLQAVDPITWERSCHVGELLAAASSEKNRHTRLAKMLLAAGLQPELQDEVTRLQQELARAEQLGDSLLHMGRFQDALQCFLKSVEARHLSAARDHLQQITALVGPDWKSFVHSLDRIVARLAALELGSTADLLADPALKSVAVHDVERPGVAETLNELTAARNAHQFDRALNLLDRLGSFESISRERQQQELQKLRAIAEQWLNQAVREALSTELDFDRARQAVYDAERWGLSTEMLASSREHIAQAFFRQCRNRVLEELHWENWTDALEIVQAARRNLSPGELQELSALVRMHQDTYRQRVWMANAPHRVACFPEQGADETFDLCALELALQQDPAWNGQAESDRAQEVLAAAVAACDDQNWQSAATCAAQLMQLIGETGVTRYVVHRTLTCIEARLKKFVSASVRKSLIAALESLPDLEAYRSRRQEFVVKLTPAPRAWSFWNLFARPSHKQESLTC